MAKKKTPNESRIRNSTAEFLTFAYQTGGDGVEVRVQDGTIWLSQKNMGALFKTSADNVGLHWKNIFKEGELGEEATAEDFSVVQKESKRQVERVITHYNLDAIIAVGYRVNSERTDADKEHIGLTNGANSPKGKIVKSDVSIAENYLIESEIDDLGRIVNVYLDLTASRAKRKIPMTMEDWAGRLDIFLSADDREILRNAGKITAKIAKAHAENEFEKYRVIQDRLFQSDFDRLVELEQAADGGSGGVDDEG
jgi:hypothetical protein